MDKIFVDLDKQISNTFKPVLYNILKFKVDKIILKGGRASFKSAVAVMGIIIGCLVNNVSALCFVKTDSSSQDKLANNFLKYMRILGVEHRFRYVKTNSKFEILDKNGKFTGQVIRLKGANNADDVKSMTTDTPEGYGYTFVEEATLFRTEDDVNSLYATAMRGTGDRHLFILVYNPPRERKHFLNVLYADKPCGIDLGYKKAYCYDIEKLDDDIAKGIDKEYSTVMIHHSTYLDALRDGFGRHIVFIVSEAERQKKSNYKAWQWDKLGMPLGDDTNVFWNIKDWEYDEDIANKVGYSQLLFGGDMSNGGSDPFAFIKVLWVPQDRDIYILDEEVISGPLNNGVVTDKFKEVAEALHRINPFNELTYCDGAVLYNLGNLRNQEVLVFGKYENLNVANAKKGFGYSKKQTAMFLQCVNNVYVCKKRTPNFYREVTGYSYVIDKAGNITTELQDGDDHLIDAWFYSFVNEINYN